MDEFNADDHYIYYYGQESHRRNGVGCLRIKTEWVQTNILEVVQYGRD